MRNTLEWRDACGRLARTGCPAADLEAEADFQALRALHAAQAARLATEPWQSDDGDIYLIDDHELRDSYGALIGNIASSHHWDLDKIVTRFSTPRPAPAFFDNDWTVDSLKIACILRVADAGHIDGARAPSFLARVLQMNFLARTHWLGQRRLGRLAVRPDNPEQVMVGSTSPFPRSEASAWWLAYDLVANFDRELRRCNDLLASSSVQSRRVFARRSVAGAGRVRQLAKYVETDNWEPVDSTVRVSDVSALVHGIRGKQLYQETSDRLGVALRELIQNAADAIAARKALANAGEFDTSIVVCLKRSATGACTLHVDDNGVGMAQSTLTTDLLNFGRSFWYSERAARQFPGLQSSGFSPVGRFGIGFFSVFAAAECVRVFSRRFDKGLNDTRCLSFEGGISLRPTLTANRPNDFGMSVCTRVELALNPSAIDGHTVNFADFVYEVAAPHPVLVTIDGVDV